MSHFAILLSGDPPNPQTVRLHEDADSLRLIGGSGVEEKVPWWRLFRLTDEGTIHRFARLDQRHWELRVTSGADRELLARIGKRPLARLMYPLRRLHFVKTVLGSIVLVAAVAQHFPAEWTAQALTPALQNRLVDAVVTQNAAKRCSHEGGEEAVRKLLVRLDPQLGRKIEIVAFNDGAFIVTATPANKIVITRGALQQTEPEAMAALLAHQLSHIRHGDAVVAMVRHEGAWGIWGAVLEGRPTDGLRMEYSGLEERRADVEAMTMLRRAQISIEPAAALFEEIRVSRAQGTFVAFDYRDFHFGIDSASNRWAAAAAEQAEEEPAVSALDRDSSDALFNFCWAGRLPPVQHRPAPSDQPPSAPGVGAISSDSVKYP